MYRKQNNYELLLQKKKRNRISLKVTLQKNQIFPEYLPPRLGQKSKFQKIIFHVEVCSVTVWEKKNTMDSTKSIIWIEQMPREPHKKQLSNKNSYVNCTIKFIYCFVKTLNRETFLPKKKILKQIKTEDTNKKIFNCLFPVVNEEYKYL